MAKEQPIIVIKKKKGGHGGHHGGAWKVAFADFMTAMMAFFLVMWLMSSEEEIRSAVATYFTNPDSKITGKKVQTAEPSIGGRAGDGESVLQGLQGAIPEDLVQHPAMPFARDLEFNPEMMQEMRAVAEALEQKQDLNLENLKFTIPEKLLFKPGSDEFIEDGYKRLNQLGRLLRNFKGKVQIEGFTDPAPDGVVGNADPYEFSLTRVVAVMAYITTNKWSEEGRLTPKVNRNSEGRGPDSGKGRVIQFTLMK